MPKRLDSRNTGFESEFNALLGLKREMEADVDDAVAGILGDVRERGDAAVIDYTARFDRLTLTPASMRVSREDIDAAAGACSDATLKALDVAARRIRAFHEKQRPADEDFNDEAGLRLGWRWTPIAAVGLYVPGGTAAYPSSVLMNALPAKVAGVERMVMVVPAPDDKLNPLVLAAAGVAGIDEIYRIGGAQAIGALAFGTATIPPVDKIVGPGNAYVAAAKRRVFGTVGIDMIAGPSEILVVADGENNPDWIAADLMSQAEHDPAAQSILLTDDAAFADRVVAAVETLLGSLRRRDIARTSWDAYGSVIVVGSLVDEAPALVDRIAPEHLELAVADPDSLLATIRNAGSIFLGRHTPEAVGDYVAGPNHVLPTNRSARFSSGLGVLDFMKRSTFIGCGSGSLAAVGPSAVALAQAEGLGAHARSISIRIDKR